MSMKLIPNWHPKIMWNREAWSSVVFVKPKCPGFSAGPIVNRKSKSFECARIGKLWPSLAGSATFHGDPGFSAVSWIDGIGLWTEMIDTPDSWRVGGCVKTSLVISIWFIPAFGTGPPQKKQIKETNYKTRMPTRDGRFKHNDWNWCDRIATECGCSTKRS